MPSTAEMSDVVRRAYDAFNRKDVRAFQELSTEDIQVVDLSDTPGAEVLCGHAGIESFFKDNWSTFEHPWGEVERIHEAGPDRILALTRHGGSARGGPSIAQHRGVLVRFSQDGKMKEIRFFGDPDEALAAAGLDEHSAA
jgi:ketosteroid isomerase-like protein